MFTNLATSIYNYPMLHTQDAFPNDVVTPQKYKGLKNPDGVNRLYRFHLFVGLIGQMLCPECKDGSLVGHEQPIGIGVVGFHSVHTRYVIIVSLYLVFNFSDKDVLFSPRIVGEVYQDEDNKSE